ncbi:hypothetical protein H4Q26_003909 [Puccinia striiformis f. sp. tritici PST-130]|nr:hypothetical protein H4Q26_003909 [Puccinia striiformis f. sp. tritici PST-130]
MLEPQLKSVVGSPYMNRTSSTTLAFPHIDRNHPFRTHLANDNRSLQELGVVVLKIKVTLVSSALWRWQNTQITGGF